MAARSGYSGTSIFARLSLFCLVVNGILFTISYATPYWTSTDRGYAGLWISCDGKACYQRWNQWVEGWIRAVQFMMSLALILWAFSVTAHFAYIFHKDFWEDKRLIFLSSIFTFIAGLLTTVSIITWSAGQSYRSSETLSWSFIICCFVCIGFFVIFYFHIRELKHRPSYEPVAS